MSDETSETIETLESIFDADWEESAPLEGPPTRWSVNERRDDANVIVSIDFMPIKNDMNATFEINGSDFSFKGKTSIEGYKPGEALEQLLDRFETHCIDALDR
jgi:hypothetical protein